MRFRQAHLPRQACVFDRGRRARAGAAIVPRNQDHISFGLSHSGSDRAHAGRGHELHCNLTARIDLLEVVDQLRQIFDRIDVVVRWRRNQCHTFCRMAQPSD